MAVEDTTASPINLERRIKRHVIGAPQELFAVSLPGGEELCRQELVALGETLQVKEVVRGGVAFGGRLTDLYRANLELRTAGRVLLRLAAFKATNFRQLERKASALGWSLYLPAGCLPELKISCHHSRLYHEKAVAERLGRSIAAHWQALAIPAAPAQGQTLYVRLADDVVTCSLDSSGDNLYRRGLKVHAAAAPLRETLAAIILRLADYDPTLPLLDPMCGAGTFSLEAALLAKAIAPGSLRRFAFMSWPAFHPRQWQHLLASAAKRVKELERPVIQASDVDPTACAALSDCVRENNLQDAIQVRQQDFFALQPVRDQPPGLIVLNPPYGRRLSLEADLEGFYRRLAAKLQQDFRGWQVALLVPGHRLARTLKLPLRALPLSHGGLTLTLLTGRL